VAGINQQKIIKTRVNRQIRAREVRLIAEDGEQLGIVPLNEALDAAVEASLDLVEINPTSTPPVCKIMDYGKYRFELSKKERESRSKRKVIEVKEVKMRPKIDTHDYETKKKMASKFLKAGNKVKVTIMFRGREVVYRKQGIDLLAKLTEELEDICVVEGKTKSEGRNISMVLAPKTQAQNPT
jgi:translation initiation factor IF-3